MTHIFNQRKLFILIFGLVLSILLVKPVHAQEDPNQIAQKYGISFPIQELGGCSGVTSCKSFCEDPVNQETCINFAKSKGFYKDDKLSERQQELLNEAKSELGCDSIESCQAACHEEVNREKCSNFAQKHNLSGGVTTDPKKAEVLEKAKSILGCDSYDSCKNFCQNDQNRQKCSEFAKQAGLRGGEQRVGPGGCNSEETCKAFCSDPNNFQVCRGFSQSAGGQFRGPGGCSDEESCKNYCKQNPDNCRSFGARGEEDISRKFCQDNPDKCSDGRPKDSGRDIEKFCLQNPDKCKFEDRNYNPQEMCTRSPNCKWVNNICQCGYYEGSEDSRKGEEYAKFCRENPDKCRNYGTPEQPRSDYPRYNYQGNYSPQPYATYKGNYSGYPAPNYTSNPVPNTPPSGMSRESQESGCKSCGGTCNWSGDFCNCQCGSSGSSGSSYSTPQPTQQSQPQPTQQSQPQPTEQPQSTPAPSSEVHGISTSNGLLQTLFNFLLR